MKTTFLLICTVIVLSIHGQSARNNVLTANGGDVTCPADGWKQSTGAKLAFHTTEGGGVAVTFDPTTHGYGNLICDAKPGPDFAAITWRERFSALRGTAKRYVWLVEPDGDLWLAAATAGEVTDEEGGWKRHTLPVTRFAYQPRGNRKREMHTVHAIFMGFNEDHIESEFRDVTLRVAPPDPLPVRPVTPKPAPGAARVCVLDADPSATNAVRILVSSGIPARLVGSDELAFADWFSRKSADLLVIPSSPFFPRGAIANFKKFLREGGSFVAYGGYAFDRLTTRLDATDAWRPAVRAREANAPNAAPSAINSRYGRAGDWVAIPRDAVQVFQPNNLVLFAESARTTEAQALLPAGRPFACEKTSEPYPAAIADVGSGDVVFTRIQGRWIPVVEALDRYGRPRGAIASVVHNFGGVYAKSSWAFSAHPTLFRRNDPSENELFVALVKNVLARQFIRTFSVEPFAADPGASVTLAADVSAPDGAEVRFLLGGRELGRARVEKGRATLAWQAPTNGGVVPLEATLAISERTADRLTSGLCVRTPPPDVPRLVWSNNYFRINGRPRFFCGVNQTGMPWFSAAENPLVWERDFNGMADYGLHMERLIHFMAAATPKGLSAIRSTNFVSTYTNFPPEMVARTDAIVQTAHAAGVSPLIALHDWIPIELDQNEFRHMDAWDDFWVRRYTDWPLMTWDAQNEVHPLRQWGASKADDCSTRTRLTARLREFYEERGVPVPARRLKVSKDGLWTIPRRDRIAADDPKGRDLELFRTWLTARWMKRIARNVHAVRSDISVAPGFTRQASSERLLDTDGMDYSITHCYDVLPVVRGELKIIDRRFEGKGLMMGEYGCRASHSARARGRLGNPDAEMVEFVLTQNLAFYGMGAACALYWTWKDNLGAEFPWGLNWPDLVPKSGVGALRNLSILLGSGTPDGTCREELFFVMPDGARLAGDAWHVLHNLLAATDQLLRQNVSFGVINEQCLSKLPASAKALIWPYAEAPREEDFAEIVAFVKRGGKVLVSGTPVRDAETRRTTHPGRLAALGLGTNPNVMWSSNVVEKAGDGTVGAFYAKFLREVVHMKPVAVPGVAGPGCCYRLKQVDGEALVRDETPFFLRTSHGRRVAAMGKGGVPGLIENAGSPCAFLALDGRDLAESEMILALPFGEASRVRLVRSGGQPMIGEVGEFRRGVWQTLERLAPARGEIGFAVDAATGTDLRLFARPDRISEARRVAANFL